MLVEGVVGGEDGGKMSKCVGKGVDGMDVMDEYGGDRLR
ncbi:class I tRNA ligase family protein [Staphylococcus pettenkoferi]